MKPNSRFTVAIHVLTLLANQAGAGEPVTSELMAASVGTNPVVIRRLLALLRQARLVRSQGGPGGGWQLTQPARAITLRDVYRAVQGEELFPLHASEPSPRCPVGAGIQAALAAPYADARLALEKQLARTTVADLLAEVQARPR